MKGEKNSQVNTNRGKSGALFKQILKKIKESFWDILQT